MSFLKLTRNSRFHDIAWGPPIEGHPRGIIAGALENGSLDLWDAEKLVNGEDGFMSRTSKHTGPIKSLQFNPLKAQILATAGAKGELYIYDINDIANPFRLGTAAARADDLECVAWNRKVPHILATGGSGGFVTIWDLKTKKASLTLNNSRKAVGAIAWDPSNATKLLTATPDDSSPVILLWDLRNSNAPERTLQGHDQGILSLSWCEQDPDLLLSSGKDNRTLLWNPQTGELYGELPEVTNWTFQTRFNPHNPALSATASFDGKITIQTLQSTNSAATQTPVAGSVDGEDFFTKAQTQPQGASFSLKRAPKWLERPVGASFGFGGKLVSFGPQAPVSGKTRSSKIQISTFTADSDVGTATEDFEKALATGDVKSITESHIAQAKTDNEKADWQVIETLIAENPRQQVVEYLGFAEDVEDIAKKMDELEVDDGLKTESGSKAIRNSRLSVIFADGVEGDDFLSNLAAAKGAKTDDPFHLFADEDSDSEKLITRALLKGQFEKAMTICIKEDRIADALIIANCGGKDLLEKAQSAYLSKKGKGPNYLRLLSSVIGKNLWDVVYNADLSNWKETLVALCTYAEPSEFPDLCEALGDRIYESGSAKDAAFCYVVGSKLEKVIPIWIDGQQEEEKTGIESLSGDSTFSVHAKSLQSFIEKVTLFREVTKYTDSEQSQSSDWKLASLYDKYAEYADIVAGHGHLSTAEKYLDLIPAQYPAAEVARERVRLASRKVAPKATKAAAVSNNTARPQASAGYQTFGAPAVTPALGRPAQNSYGPPTSQTPSANPYATAVASTPSANPYAPPTNNFTSQPGYQPQQQGGYQPPQAGQQSFGQPQYGNQGFTTPSYGAPQQSFAPPPPRNTTPGIPPPSRAKDMVNWNDTPVVNKPTPARRTPAPQQNMASTPYQHNLSMPPPTNQFAPRSTATPPPPPPKGPAPPRVTSPPQISTGPPRPSSSAANTYSPQISSPAQQFNQMMAPPTIPRGSSPYNAPPAGAPPTNRYAPSPAQQQYSQPPAQNLSGPPPGARPPPPSNPYASIAAPSNNSYAPSPSQFAPGQPPQQSFNPQGPPPGGPPPGGPPPAARQATGPPPRATPPPAAAKPKHPSGDRSHIPASAQRLVEIFTTDMQRVAAKAPQSFAPQVKDTQKRLNILFDHLNNEELVKPDTIQQLSELAEALASKNFDQAAKLQVDIQREKTDECGNWMVSSI